MKKTFILVACALSLAAMISACGGKKPVLLTQEQVQQKVDSLYNAQVSTLGPELDKACEIKFESLVQVAVDSIMTANNPAIQ